MWNRPIHRLRQTHSFAAVPRIKIDSVDKNVTFALGDSGLSFFELLVFEILASSFWANQKQAISRDFARNNQPNFIEF
jgi:hypothetical protein